MGARVAGIIAVGLVLAFCSGQRRDPLPIAPTQWVTDTTGFLSKGVREETNERLKAYQETTGHHVLVWIASERLPQGRSVDDFCFDAFNAWGVGRDRYDDGVVLFVFPQERKFRIQVGYGLERAVPDAEATRIGREILTPDIRAGRRDAAVTKAVSEILRLIDDSEKPAS